MENQDFKDIAELVTRGFGVISVPNSDPRIILPNGHVVHEIKGTLLHPARKVSKRMFRDVGSFCSYVNEQKLTETRIYATTDTTIVAVLDHHQESAGVAGYGEHTAQLTLTHSPEWKTWSEKNKVKFGQREFTVFLDDNKTDVIRPTGADFLDLIRQLKVTVSAEFNGVVDEKPGNCVLNYQQQTKTQAGQKGEIELPDDFDISVSPYLGNPATNVTLRLRFEVSNGRLVLWFEMVRVERLLQVALKNIVSSIEDDTEITVWYGTP